ncbi:hypothetical protein [Escherichia albertii]|uniref:hypothetical protein n=1 Tax=Escherichia albertii TaxID=208962 RepID=UPI0023614912|nr:hypothetical protein [Escherichia albertii]WDB23228.1 hypothetical protein PS035_15210 [Escherichia albertii]
MRAKIDKQELIAVAHKVLDAAETAAPNDVQLRLSALIVASGAELASHADDGFDEATFATESKRHKTTLTVTVKGVDQAA